MQSINLYICEKLSSVHLTRTRSRIVRFLFLINLFTINGQNFELDKILSNPYVLNIVNNEKGVFLGTKDGIYGFNKDELYLVDDNIKQLINSNLEPLDLSFIQYATSYNELLPKEYQNSFITAIEQNGKLMLVSRGKLFVFKKAFYDFQPNNSVRSISENYLGTYGGIYNNGELLKYPTYTSGKIREFEDKTFICYDGLFVIDKNGNTTDYKSFETTSLERKTSFTKNIGLVKDIIQMDKDSYFVFSSRGIYLFNLKNTKISTLFELTEGDDFVEFIDFIEDLGIYFFTKNTVYKIDINERKIQLIHNTEQDHTFLTVDKRKGINKFYTISSADKLVSHEYVNEKWIIQELADVNPLCHSIYYMNNYLLLVGNNGLDVYDLTTGKLFENIISDELNKYAYNVSGDEIQLGGIYGLYKFSFQDLKNHLDFYETKTPELNRPKESPLITKLFLILFFLLIIIGLLLRRKSKPVNVKASSLRLEKIDAYIDRNISTVTIKEISDQFDIKVHELYEIMDGVKPGKYIRDKRVKIVKRMRKEGASTEEIAEKSGFSISYLKKL